MWVTRAGLAGSTLGVAAGIIQVSVGTQIPQWSGAKSAPVALGLLTIGLSLVAGWAAIAQRRRPTVEARAACALGMIGPGLLCLSTVGGLWYLPAVLLVVAGVMTVEGWRDTGRAVVENWFRVLLSALGGFEILMAAGASAVPMAVGVVSGLLLMIVPWLRRVSRRVWIGLVVAGTVPFAVLAPWIRRGSPRWLVAGRRRRLERFRWSGDGSHGCRPRQHAGASVPMHRGDVCFGRRADPHQRIVQLPRWPLCPESRQLIFSLTVRQ